MPRKKSMTTVARELAKTYSPEQLRKLSEEVLMEAAKPRVDKRILGRLHRAVKAAYIKQFHAEEELTAYLSEAGKTNDEINQEVDMLRRDAERDAISIGAPGPSGRKTKA